jgi:hypothetical protein
MERKKELLSEDVGEVECTIGDVPLVLNSTSTQPDVSGKVTVMLRT